MNKQVGLIRYLQEGQLSLFKRHEEFSVFGIPIQFPKSASRGYDEEAVNNIIHDAFREVPSFLIEGSALQKIIVDEMLLSSGYNAKVDIKQRMLRIAPITDKKKLASSICHEMVHVLLGADTAFRNIFLSKEMVQEYRAIKREVISRIISYRKKGLARHYSFDERWLQRIASDVRHNDRFEEYLKNDVKYPFIFQIAGKVIPEPYMINSLEEYICVGFQYYFFENHSVLKNGSLCHILYATIDKFYDNHFRNYQFDDDIEIDPEVEAHMKERDRMQEEYPHW